METSLKKNYIYSIAYQILTLFTPLITTPHVSRIFGAEYLGIYSYTNTIAQYFVLFAVLGLNNYGNRTIAMVRDDKKRLDKTFSEIYTMQLVTGIISLCAYVVFVFIFIKEYKLYLFILNIYILSSVLDINWLFFGLEKFKLTVTRNAIIKLLSVVAILTLVRDKEDLWLYTAIFAMSAFLSNALLWIYAAKEVKFVKPSIRGVSKHLKPNLVMFVPVIAISIYKYTDKLMLGSFSKTEVGYYENVEKIFTVAMGFVTAFGNVMLPRMSNLASKSGMDGVRKAIATSMRFVIGLSIALSFGIASIAHDFVGVYYGPGFEPSITLMVVLAPTIIFQSWANVVRTQYLIPFKHDAVYIVSVMVGAVVNLVINLLLISTLGAIGAALGTVVAEFSVAVIQTLASRHHLDYKIYFREGVPFVLIGALMYIVNLFIRDINLQPLIRVVLQVIVGGGIYVLSWGAYEMLLHRRREN